METEGTEKEWQEGLGLPACFEKACCKAWLECLEGR